jgi:hypothetical protein
MCHLIFGVLVIAATQILSLVTPDVARSKRRLPPPNISGGRRTKAQAGAEMPHSRKNRLKRSPTESDTVQKTAHARIIA